MENQNNLPATAGSQAPAVFNFFNKEQFEVMQRICKMFASSELVPDMYKASETNPEAKATANCMIAIEMSQRIGASPLMIMQNMVIIYGRPSWSSKFLIATVNTCGRFNPLKFRFTALGIVGKITLTAFEKKWQAGVNGAKGRYVSEAKTTEFDGTKIENLQCIAYTTAKGSEEILESAPIDIKLAIQEGWYTKAGSKWTTMTRQMLMYRAASFWTNAYAPELSMGMKTEEELRDIIDVDFEDVSDRVETKKAEEANKTTLKMEVTHEELKPQVEEKDNGEKHPEKTPETVAQNGQIAANQLFDKEQPKQQPQRGF